MNKKIIAALLVATFLFVGIFAACQKNDGEIVYVENEDIAVATDENGEIRQDEDGRLIVYATDEAGDYVTNKNGEYETLAQEFQPIEQDGVVEDLAFKFNIPDGWKSVGKFGHFENTLKKQQVDISVVEFTFKDYYTQNKNFYDQLKASGEKVDVTWTENVELGEDFHNVCRFTMATEEGIVVMYFFENSRNVYKVLFTSEKPDNVIPDSEAICKAMTFKSYVYYPDVTSSTAKAK